ncbi:MAG TPA: hypothetical protein HPP77_11225 [Candidatus Hydrogenedentes bacterium]|nr:hypothetical protein [Candidatus Hydrogenedentota bacterium]HIJ74052.1 hypothetical protein [Candidatus Hydrogenedentota bacterium]
MNEQHESVRDLISGYLDGELGPDDRAKVERHLAEDPAFREEFEKMKRLISAASRVRFEFPPEEVWDTFLEGVYNRIERRTGWLVFIIGAIALAGYGVFVFIRDPWGPALIKLLIAAPVVGLVILFVSVLRQRLIAAKTDRYSKEVHR